MNSQQSSVRAYSFLLLGFSPLLDLSYLEKERPDWEKKVDNEKGDHKTGD
jgi:hypothetical protein